MMNSSDFINSVVGKPWVNRSEGPDSYDCWGLVIDSFRKIDGLEIPQVAGYDNKDFPTDRAASGEIETGNWSLSQPCEGAVMVGYESGRPIHVGRVVCGGVLHSFGKDGKGSVKWNTFRVINSIFRDVKYYAYNHSQPRSV